MHIDRNVVDREERSTISEIAGRKSTLVRNIPDKCKEEFESVTDTAKFVYLFLTREQKHLCVCMKKMLDEIRNEHNWGHNS